MTFRVSFCIESGKNKKLCDDSALVGTSIINDETGVLEVNVPTWICLCDGVGGNAGGQEASLFVTQKLSTAAIPTSIEDVKRIAVDINTNLLEQAVNTIDHKTMATTATAICFTYDSVFMFHVGNTRLYSKRGPYIQQITVDQTTYQWLLDRGNIEAAEACNKSEITGAMGGGRADLLNPIVVEQIFERKIPTTIILTTDGVHEFLCQDEIEEVLANDKTMLEKAQMLCKQALEQGSDDDRSVIIIESINRN
ncbi:PP2C family protein-serine/threonine phosphatase [Aristaeella lactis]|uniref:Serine/threonine protein phosphatase PrpC n=1 Tax=Aristaeella lactis TaxID=3046383 RepID=A0AC61PLJ6_9FIRM|nr:serine/threonine-protein phosphatase [Aristaeella lactis]QUA54668.1 serine/threonine-protein phosphatase [Aristaeella lactis]SMC63575.1 Serine/threonine protein phosphatase PrpC [Aristaeella lactis]